jgi:NAD kinase
MGLQYEMNLKVIERIFSDKKINKISLKKEFCTEKTQRNSFDLIFKDLKNLNIISKKNILSRKYIKVYKIKDNDKKTLANSMASNFQEYQNEIIKFEKILKNEFLVDYHTSYKNIYDDFVNLRNELYISSFQLLNLLIENINFLLNEHEDIKNIKNSNIRKYIRKIEIELKLRDFLILLNNQKKDFSNIQRIIDANYELLEKIGLDDKNVLEEQSEYDYQKTYSMLDKRKIKDVTKFDKTEIEIGENYPNIVETIKIPYIEYTFKGVLIRILQENMQFIDNDDIYGVIASIELKYQIEFNKRTKRNIVSKIVPILYLLGLIIDETEKPKKKNHIPNMDFDKTQNKPRYKLVEIKEKKYRISLASKVETIQNIVPSISNFKALDKSLTVKDIEDIKRLFNYE